MKNIEVVQQLNLLNALFEAEKKANTQRLTAKTHFAAKRNMRELEACYYPYADALTALQAKYMKDGKLDEGNAEYQKELKELLLVENNISIQKISLEEFAACKDLTYTEQEALFFMIKE